MNELSLTTLGAALAGCLSVLQVVAGAEVAAAELKEAVNVLLVRA